MTADSSSERHHTVLVRPKGLSFEAAEGETVFAAARRNGLHWPTRCQGRASCKQCFFEVLDSQGLFEKSRLESDALRRVVPAPERGGQMRLACQARVRDDVEVWKIGVRPAEPDDEKGGDP